MVKIKANNTAERSPKPGDEARGQALNGIASRLALPLTRIEIRRNLGGAQAFERHPILAEPLMNLTLIGNDGEGGKDRMATARKPL